MLLTEAGAAEVSNMPVSVEGRGIEAAADWKNLKSAENYVGYAQTRNFASPGGAAPDKPRMYELPMRLHLNQWALSGDWTVARGSAALNKANGSLAFCHREPRRPARPLVSNAARRPPCRRGRGSRTR